MQADAVVRTDHAGLGPVSTGRATWCARGPGGGAGSGLWPVHMGRGRAERGDMVGGGGFIRGFLLQPVERQAQGGSGCELSPEHRVNINLPQATREWPCTSGHVLGTGPPGSRYSNGRSGLINPRYSAAV